MADGLSFDVRLQATGDGPVTLPRGETAVNAQFARSGDDLILREPDGHTIKIDGYFSHNPPPDLVSSDGAKLPHDMVDAFLAPEHPGQYAANATADDASPIGKVTQVVGDATITHPDGTHIKAEVGVTVHMGDVIETSDKGAVHILFVDNTTFAVSEHARLSIDQYTYNPESHTGTSFFSMLHGVFVYTSGLIGKSDPADVNIHTPVGSIGIRGTVIAGEINVAGQPSTVTVVDGAIVVSNDGGTVTMSSALDTATLTGYSTAPTDTGVMTTQTFNSTYSAVAPADPAFYSMTGTSTTTAPAPVVTSPDTGTTTTPTAPAPTTTAPDTMTQAAPGDTVGTTVTVTSTSTVNVTDPYDPTVTDPTVALNNSTVVSPTSASTFTSDTTTFGTTSTGTTSFTGTTATFGGAPATDSTGTSSTTLAATSTTSTSSTSFSTTSNPSVGSTATTTTGGGTTITPLAPPLTASFAFSGVYTNGTPSTADDGLPLFGPQLASLFSSQNWSTTSVLIGTINTTGMTNPTFSMVTSSTLVAHTGGGGGYDLLGDTVTPTTAGLSTTTPGQVIAHFDITSTGQVMMTFSDPTGLAYQPNNTFNFSVTATDGTTSTSVSTPVSLQFEPHVSGPVNLLFGGEAGAGTIDVFGFTGGNNVIFERNGQLGSTGGAQVIGTTASEHDVIVLGTAGGDSVLWLGQGTVQIYGNGGSGETITMTTPGFLTDGTSVINGGTGSNETLRLGSTGASGQVYNFEGASNVTNIEKIMVAASPTGTPNATVTLDMQNIFDMNPAHTLEIGNLNTGYSTVVNLDTKTAAGVSEGTMTATFSGGQETLTGTLISNGQTVTLIIDRGAGTLADGIPSATVH